MSLSTALALGLVLHFYSFTQSHLDICLYRAITDNQSHLQALRHLYVLAIEERCLSTLDVEQEQSVSVDVQVLMRTGEVLRLKSPTLLPELSTVASISLCSDEYLSASIVFERGACVCCCSGGQRAWGSAGRASRTSPAVRLRALASTAGRGRATSHQRAALDLQCLQRCASCPQATVLYIKKKEAVVWSKDCEIFQDIDHRKGARRGEICSGAVLLLIHGANICLG